MFKPWFIFVDVMVLSDIYYEGFGVTWITVLSTQEAAAALVI